MKGSFVSLPQDMPTVAKILPATASTLADFIQSVFIGSDMPTRAQLRNHFRVRKRKVMAALAWLCANHPDYIAEMAKSPAERRTRFIPESMVVDLPDNDIPDALYESIVQRFREPQGQNPSMANYVPDRDFFLDNEADNDNPGDLDCGMVHSGAVDGVLHSSKQSAAVAAAQSHLQTQLHRLQGNVGALRNSANSGTQQRLIMPHGSNPIDWWFNPRAWQIAYSHLLPFGVGAPESDRGSDSYVSLKRWSQHVLRHHQTRFRKDSDLLFTMYNVMRVRETCYEAKAYLQSGSAANLPELIAGVTLDVWTEAYKEVADAAAEKRRVRTSDLPPPVAKLVGHVQAVEQRLEDSERSKRVHGYKIRGCLAMDGEASIFLTLNFSELDHPLVLHFCGRKFDLTVPDSLGPKSERVTACLEDPLGGTMFYHHMCEAFLAHLLGYKKLKGHVVSRHVGLLGRVR